MARLSKSAVDFQLWYCEETVGSSCSIYSHTSSAMHSIYGILLILYAVGSPLMLACPVIAVVVRGSRNLVIDSHASRPRRPRRTARRLSGKQSIRDRNRRNMVRRRSSKTAYSRPRSEGGQVRSRFRSVERAAKAVARWQSVEKNKILMERSCSDLRGRNWTCFNQGFSEAPPTSESISHVGEHTSTSTPVDTYTVRYGLCRAPKHHHGARQAPKTKESVAYGT